MEVRDPETGQYLPGNTTGGRTVGTKETFPRNAFKAMAAIIEGRLREAQGDTPISEPMTQLLFDGIRGKIVISSGKQPSSGRAGPATAPAVCMLGRPPWRLTTQQKHL